MHIELVRDRLRAAIIGPGISDMATTEGIVACADATKRMEVLSIDHFASRYCAYHLDFGPVNLSASHRCFDWLDTRLFTTDAAADHDRQPVIVVMINLGMPATVVTNIVTLLVLYLIDRFNCAAEAAWSYFASCPIVSAVVLPFHDASPHDDEFCLTVFDVAKAWERALSMPWCSLRADHERPFKAEDFDAMERLENGDRTWIVPGKMLAFSSPGEFLVHANDDMKGDEAAGLHPQALAKLMQRDGVNTIVALNGDTRYRPSVFTDLGMRYFDLSFPDGEPPRPATVMRFFDIARHPAAVVAVHCKAGLGRTGSLIGAYLISEFRFSAREAVGWLRLCRPGSVIGPQQPFLEEWATAAHSTQPPTPSSIAIATPGSLVAAASAPPPSVAAASATRRVASPTRRMQSPLRIRSGATVVVVVPTATPARSAVVNRARASLPVATTIATQSSPPPRVHTVGIGLASHEDKRCLCSPMRPMARRELSPPARQHPTIDHAVDGDVGDGLVLTPPRRQRHDAALHAAQMYRQPTAVVPPVNEYYFRRLTRRVH